MNAPFLSDLTVFVISSGNNPCYNDCLSSLDNQTVSFKIEIIKNIYPMSKAFQIMIDDCKTDYYVEIDEDMIINYNGIETLYTSIKNSNSMVAMIAYKLIDMHLDFEIYGVKIYKHAVLKKYPYDLSSMSCEVEQLDRLKKDGFEVKLSNDVIGKHAPKWSNESIFERYQNLLDKFKQFKYIWMSDLPKKLWSILKKEPTENNLYALLGAYTSLSTDNIQTGEKDFRNRHMSFERMKSFLNPPVSANLYLTSKCNFNCKFCYRNTNSIELATDMTIRNVHDLLIKFPSINSFCCAGYGEPFLCDNLFDIISFIKSKNKMVSLITNGSLIIDCLDKLLANRPDYISISLNAPNEQLHNEINKTFTFSKVVQGIKHCVDNGLQTYCSYVCTKSNLKYVPKFLTLVNSLGVKTVHLLNLLPHLASSYDDKSFWREVLTYDDKNSVDALLDLPESNLIKLYPTLMRYNEVRCNCQIPWTTIGINGDDSVTFCGSVYAPNKEIGSLKTFENVWQNDNARKLRDSFCDIKSMSDTCKLCFRNWDEYKPKKSIITKRKLTICKIIDQYGWAYYFVAKEQQLYTSNIITYKRLVDVIDINADVVYIHAPNIHFSKINELIVKLKQKGIKIIGGYGGESKLKYETDPDIIVSISIRHLDYLKNIYPNKTVVFLPESVDTNFFTKFNKTNNDFIVGWAGCARQVKRPYLLDKLIFKVIKKSDWGREYFVDGQTLDKMKAFYQSIDVLVLTSISECMPRVVLEAMSCGLPVISTRVGCISILLEKDWIVSALPDEQVIKEMNEKLLLLKNNPELRKIVGNRNRQHIEKFFSWTVNQKLWDTTFELLVQNRLKDIQILSDNFMQSLPNYKELVFKNLEAQTEQINFLEIEKPIEPIACIEQPPLITEPVPTKPPAKQMSTPTVEIKKIIRPVFISYYTKNTGYESEYPKLEMSLKRFNLDYEIVSIQSQGDWFANCFYRSIFVKDMLDKYKRPVIWIDCDAIVQQDPVLFLSLIEYDFAYHLRQRRNGNCELLGGTMYFNYTNNVFMLLTKWVELVNKDRKKYRLDQSFLHEAVNLLKGLKVFHLPATYCQIFDIMKDEGTPVIEHFQASRKYKIK